jgi:hypothetical protein
VRLFTRQAVPDHGVFRLLGEHCGEDFDFRLDHQFVYPISQINCYSPLVNPLGHLSPNRSLANLATLYPFDGLSDLHRHFKLAIILGLSECGQNAFVP